MNEQAKAHRILLMDDEDIILDLTSRMLNLFGYDVDTAIDGTRALRMIETAISENRPYSLVILDLVIPGGIGGKEVILELKKQNIDINTMVISGYHTDPAITDHSSFGFDYALKKPFRMQEMQKALNTLLTVD